MLRLATTPTAEMMFQRSLMSARRYSQQVGVGSAFIEEAGRFLAKKGESQDETFAVCKYRVPPVVVVPTVQQSVVVPDTIDFGFAIKVLLNTKPSDLCIASLDMPNKEVLIELANLAKMKKAISEPLSITLLGAPHPDKWDHVKHGQKHVNSITNTIERDPMQEHNVFFGKTSQLSWNHSKYFIADSRLILGGINFDPSHYQAGVADIALMFDSPELALFTKHHMYMQCEQIAARSNDWSPTSRNWASHVIKDFDELSLGPVVGEYHSQCLVAIDSKVAKKGEGQAASKIIPWLIDKAESEICISQQDLGFSLLALSLLRPYFGSKAGILRPFESLANSLGKLFVREIMESLNKAVIRGVKVKIVLSADGVKVNGIPYYYLGHKETERYLHVNIDKKHHHLLEVIPAPKGNHMKAIVVDRRLSLIGSKNMYPTNLDDTVVIIEDEGVSDTILKVIEAAT